MVVQTSYLHTIFQGKVVVIRGEGPKGGPGMPEMLTPTSAIMGAGLGKVRNASFISSLSLIFFVLGKIYK